MLVVLLRLRGVRSLYARARARVETKEDRELSIGWVGRYGLKWLRLRWPVARTKGHDLYGCCCCAMSNKPTHTTRHVNIIIIMVGSGSSSSLISERTRNLCYHLRRA